MSDYGVYIDTIRTGTYDIIVYANPAGGRTYYSTELGQVIWDTAIDDKALLDVVLALEAIYARQDAQMEKEGRNPVYSKLAQLAPLEDVLPDWMDS